MSDFIYAAAVVIGTIAALAVERHQRRIVRRPAANQVRQHSRLVAMIGDDSEHWAHGTWR